MSQGFSSSNSVSVGFAPTTPKLSTYTADSLSACALAFVNSTRIILRKSFVTPSTSSSIFAVFMSNAIRYQPFSRAVTVHPSPLVCVKSIATFEPKSKPLWSKSEAKATLTTLSAFTHFTSNVTVASLISRIVQLDGVPVKKESTTAHEGVSPTGSVIL